MRLPQSARRAFRSVILQRKGPLSAEWACVVLLRRNGFQQFSQQRPVLAHAFDMNLLIRGVRTGDGWPDRNHVHIWIRFFEQTALQARVDNLDVRRLVEQTLIGFTHQMHHRRVGVRLPARVGAFRFGFRTGQLAQRIQHAHDIIFSAVD